MKIVVLAGGLSAERAVSLVSGAGICRALRERGHRAILVDLFLGLEELPAFFQSDGYARICEARLSCTSFGNAQMKSCYFPPVMPHGLGIFYHVDETAYAVITAFLEDDGLLDTFIKHLYHAVELILSC